MATWSRSPAAGSRPEAEPRCTAEAVAAPFFRSTGPPEEPDPALVPLHAEQLARFRERVRARYWAELAASSRDR